MCLDTLDKIPKKTTVGWKIFQVYRGEITSPWFPTRAYPESTWIKDNNEKGIIYSKTHEPPSQKEYPAGFHFFRHREGAESFLQETPLLAPFTEVLKIKCRQVHTTGKDSSQREVACAKEIFIWRRDNVLSDYTRASRHRKVSW